MENVLFIYVNLTFLHLDWNRECFTYQGIGVVVKASPGCGELPTVRGNIVEMIDRVRGRRLHFP